MRHTQVTCDRCGGAIEVVGVPVPLLTYLRELQSEGGRSRHTQDYCKPCRHSLADTLELWMSKDRIVWDRGVAIRCTELREKLAGVKQDANGGRASPASDSSSGPAATVET